MFLHVVAYKYRARDPEQKMSFDSYSEAVSSVQEMRHDGYFQVRYLGPVRAVPVTISRRSSSGVVSPAGIADFARRHAAPSKKKFYSKSFTDRYYKKRGWR